MIQPSLQVSKTIVLFYLKIFKFLNKQQFGLFFFGLFWNEKMKLTFSNLLLIIVFFFLNS